MKLLLDTHVLLWWHHEPARVPRPVIDAMRQVQTTLWISIASAWEMMIKQQAGKLSLLTSVQEILETQRRNDFTLLDIKAAHVLALEGLPPIHKDPFDRILVAQAIREDMTLVTADQTLQQYPVKIFW